MAMRNTEEDFYGRQEGERILYVVRPHQLSTTLKLIKVFGVALIISIVMVILGTQIETFRGLFVLIGVFMFFIINLVGVRVIFDWQKREIAYITDRRLVRFEPTTLFATNSRTLTWDEVVKVKTYPPNVIWKQLAIGNVVVHARTSIRTAEDTPMGTVTADDIEIRDVFYYRDLGNYIDKILFTYKQMPSDIQAMRPFVPRPRGQRY
jgi:uncharacterized membrane protein